MLSQERSIYSHSHSGIIYCMRLFSVTQTPRQHRERKETAAGSPPLIASSVGRAVVSTSFKTRLAHQLIALNLTCRFHLTEVCQSGCRLSKRFVIVLIMVTKPEVMKGRFCERPPDGVDDYPNWRIVLGYV